MLERERVKAALEFRRPDVVPLRVFAAPGGLHEHGQKLVDLIAQCGHDFGDLRALRLPDAPGAGDFDADGRYHARRQDEWGVNWEFLILGVWGHVIDWPLKDWAALDSYRLPAPPPAAGPEFESVKAARQAHRQRYYHLGWGGSIFEKMCSLRPFEEVLMDIALDSPQVHRLADLLVDNCLGHVRRDLALGADGIAFGDDFGTQRSPLFSMDHWRRFFKPRYQRLFEPVVRANKTVFLHSCGQIEPLLEDLAEIGVKVLWPQLPVFDLKLLAARCRQLRMAVELHPDRGDLMQRATPKEVRDYVRRLADTFGTAEGGSWLYVEIDPGFPWANVEALLATVMELRGRPASPK
jgi:uroporphyrinogen decarboxylase